VQEKLMRALESLPLPEMVRRFITFAGVGVINTAVGLAIILTLSEPLHVNYLVANAIGYLFGLGMGFFMHRGITFRDVSHMNKMGAQFRSFAMIFVIGYAVQFAALFVMEHTLGWANWFSQVVACGLYIVISFTGNRFMTFPAAAPEKPE
jgi:putative flippase GtrA